MRPVAHAARRPVTSDLRGHPTVVWSSELVAGTGVDGGSCTLARPVGSGSGFEGWGWARQAECEASSVDVCGGGTPVDGKG